MFSPNVERTLADDLEALKFGPVAEVREDISLTSLRHYKTRLWCRTHGLQGVADVSDALTVNLACGCTRSIGERRERTKRGRIAA